MINSVLGTLGIVFINVNVMVTRAVTKLDVKGKLFYLRMKDEE